MGVDILMWGLKGGDIVVVELVEEVYLGGWYWVYFFVIFDSFGKVIGGENLGIGGWDKVLDRLNLIKVVLIVWLLVLLVIIMCCLGCYGVW